LHSIRAALLIEGMRTASGAPVLLCVAAAFVIGCGGGHGGGAVPMDQLGAEYASVFCHKAFTCCDATELAGGNVTTADEATCRSLVGPEISSNVADNQADVSGGRLVYHGDSARRCLDTLAALPCAQWGGDEELARFADCQHVFEGLVAPLAPCVRNAECADGFCDTTAGVCRALPKLGESCPSGLCSEGLACLSNPTTGATDVCGAPLGDGSPCHYDSECTSAFCNIDPGGSTSSCGPATFCNGV
jgi:hypothetical protein